jgi:hypothetical protein
MPRLVLDTRNPLAEIRCGCQFQINVEQFALKAGINAGLLRNYINGYKKPSQEREAQILQQIHQLGKEFTAVTF